MSATDIRVNNHKPKEASMSHLSLIALTSRFRLLLAAVGISVVLSVAMTAMPATDAPVLRAAAPQPASANAFSDYVRCITGVGAPIGTAWALAPYLPAILRGVAQGIPPGSIVPRGLATVANRYGRSVYNSCRRFINS